MTQTPPPGQDTATGTDPAARYDHAGYEDKSLGQAVEQDEELVDRLMDETGGDAEEAERRFARESAGAPALARQQGGAADGSTAGGGTPTGGSAESAGATGGGGSAGGAVEEADRRNGEPGAQG